MQLKLRRRMASVHHTVMVLSGKGGVGKSTVAANLAVALAERGLRVGLLDVDIHGPSIPKLLHVEDQRPGPSPDGGIVPIAFDMGIKVMSIAFFLPHSDEAVIWRGPRKYSAIEQLLAETDWGELDVLVVDAPPGTGDEPLAVAQLIPRPTAPSSSPPRRTSRSSTCASRSPSAGRSISRSSASSRT
jgi:Mrp family chromosome partitioning ATPase